MKLNAFQVLLILLFILLIVRIAGNSYREYMTSNTISGPEGNEATVYTGSDGNKAVASDGSVYYNSDNVNSGSSNVSSSANTYTGPQGNQATVITNDDGQKAVAKDGTVYYNEDYDDNQDDDDDDNTNSASATTYTGPAGNQATVYTGPQGNSAVSTNGGIPASQIVPGTEDLYILKSEIVPPVCPACPPATACPRQEPCPPCPPCARCPEPAFECKKVPNYSSSNDQYLPRPVMADFSQFGM